MIDKPLVSVLMNCYNGECYLAEAIESVLAQTYSNWELLFWDNQSDDESAFIFKSYQDQRLKYYKADSHTDLGNARANGYSKLSGSYMAILDVDDIWEADKLEKQMALFDDEDVAVVSSNSIDFTDNVEKKHYDHMPSSGWVFDELVLGYHITLSTLLINMRYVCKLSYAFDREFSYISDYDLVVRLSRIGKVLIHPETLVRRRVHDQSCTWVNPDVFLIEHEKWIKKHSKSGGLLGDRKILISRIMNKNYRNRAIRHLMQFNNLKAIKALRLSEYDHWHSYVLLMLCLIPCSGLLIIALYNKKYRLVSNN